ncbi:MAG: FHA domain-containing protein [Polyangiaceae bacterium]|nr:FHA domain-containing protein [Polyangiaceae bacterium]NUQ74625.1 FHA domain-containing protein [Polyangiaceae bacterium]
MGILVDARTNRALTLPARCLLGRSSACALRIDDARVSGEHARISWSGDRWEVRDLGSRNGTFVNDTKLERGGSSLLSASDRIALGDVSIALSLLDVSPPVAQARQLVTGEIMLARGGILALPSEEAPDVSILQDADGRWIVEEKGAARVVSDGDVIEARGESYALHLPTLIASTVDARDEPPDIRDVTLHFRVSRDEEHVEVTIRRGDEVLVMAPRAHHYTLLTLARARHRDEAEGKLPEPSRGWISVDDLCRMLATDENKMNVDFYRIRQDVGALGLQNAASIIERRRGSRQVRQGIRRVVLETL